MTFLRVCLKSNLQLLFRHALSLIFFFIGNNGSLVTATSPDDLFLKANGAFVSGKYAEAIQDDETLLKHRCYSVPIFYNLANAYFRDGKVGFAILNYERALWLAPRDADIKANLQLARHRAGLFESTPVGWQALPGILRLDTWTWLVFLTFVFLCAAWSIHMFKMDVKWRIRPWMIFFGLLWIVSLVSATVRVFDLNRGVILIPEAALRIAPLDNSPSFFNLPVGSIVHIQKQRDGFFYLRTQDGKMGWVLKKQMQPIVPRT